MYLDWDFALLLLPVVIAGAVCFAVGSWAWKRFAPSKVASAISNIFYFIGIVFLAIGAVAMMWNMFGPIVVAAYCFFATCG